jgi:heme/copper-type cytochrome/quinol oxidase subunit 4
MAETTVKSSNGMTMNYLVYAVILAIAVAQVLFAMLAGPQPMLMLLLAFLQASLAVNHFMHLKQESPGLFFALIPYTLFVLFMMNMIWSDSFRLLHLRPLTK